MSIKPSTEKHHKIPNCSIGATCKVYQDLGGGDFVTQIPQPLKNNPPEQKRDSCLGARNLI